MTNSTSSQALPNPEKSGLRQFFRQKFRQRTLRVKQTDDAEMLLSLRRVYIVPSKPGLAYVVMLILLFIGAINYNLSLGFALTFLLIGVGIIDMHLTFRNLAHLYLQIGRVAPVFAGQEAEFEFSLENRKNLPRYAIWLGFVAPELDYAEQAVDLDGHSKTTLKLGVRSRQRGLLPAPKLRLHTRFPLGLLSAWSYWQAPMTTLVYPFPEEDAPALPISQTGSGTGQGHAGEDDFSGIRQYQAGDPMKRLAWRQIARLDPALGGQLVSKYFEGGADCQVNLDYASLPNELDMEAKLSRLTRWVLQAEQDGVAYSFSLGNLHLPLGSGAEQQAACLRALALFENSDATPNTVTNASSQARRK